MLDGGLRRWTQLGLPIDTTCRHTGAGTFVGARRPGLAVDGDARAGGSRRPGATRLLDARAAERYRGEVEPIDPVAGHVPGARNHPFVIAASARTAGSCPRDELRAALAAPARRRAAPERTIAMCGSGVTACHMLLAMEHAGTAGARSIRAPGASGRAIRRARSRVARRL